MRVQLCEAVRVIIIGKNRIEIETPNCQDLTRMILLALKGD